MKLGLILEGGASRAYFSSGVMDALLEENIIADYVIGTSAGIANAVSYASGQIGRNLSIAKDYLHDKRYMGFKHMLNPNNRSYYNLDFVFDSIPNIHLPFDYDAFNNFKGEVVAAVTNINTGKAEYLPVPRDDKKFNVLRASCALPLLFPIITINGQKYMDGGIFMPIPADEAIRSGCDKNIVILTRERGYRKSPEKSLELAAKLYRQYPKFVDVVIKMGCNVVCPFLPSKHEEDWGLDDPSGKSDEEFMFIINKIEEKVKDLRQRLINGDIKL